MSASAPPSPDPDHRNPDPTSPPTAPPTPTPLPLPSRQRARFSLDTNFTRLNDPDPTSSKSATSTRSNSPEPLRTPTLSESYADLRRNLSLHSLRELEARQLQEAIWRKGEKRARKERTERVNRPGTMEECWAHAVRGGLRSAVLAGAIRSGVNLIILALSISKRKRIKFRLVLHALFGPDTIRFSALMGLFTSLYKFALHSLRLFNFGALGPGREEWWHASLAGAIAGLAVAVEKPARRITIGQQLLVRGAAAGATHLSGRGWHVPNGDALVFGLACGQIMYSFLASPSDLPRGYWNWILNASRVAKPAVMVNLSTGRTGKFDPAVARQGLKWKAGPTPRNAALIKAYAAKGDRGDFGLPYAPCALIHPWLDSCTVTFADRFQSVFRWVLPTYLGLNILPPLVLRYKKFTKDPKAALRKALLSTLRSCSFLGLFVAIYQGLLCTRANLDSRFGRSLPRPLQAILHHKGYYWFAGFATCLSLALEEKKRRAELALYCLPRALEALWVILRRRKVVPRVPAGDIVLSCVGAAMTMGAYEHEPRALSGLLRALLFQFVGHS